MLKVFRDNLKSLAWILWVVIALFVLGLAVEFGGNLRNQGRDAPAATVGHMTVTRSEFQRAYQNLAGMYRQVYGDQLNPEIEKQIYMQALNRTVNQKILLDEARRLGLTVSDAELAARILEIPGLKDDKGRFIGEQQYRQVLAQNQIKVADFERELREELLMKKLTDTLSATLYVTEDEVQRSYRDQVERAKIRYLQLPRARFAAQAQASPAEVEAYFKAHQAELRLPEQRDVAYLLVDGARVAEQVNPSEAELRGWYDAHKADFTQEEQVRARHILVQTSDERDDAAALARAQQAKSRIAGGADFAAAAREFSDDTATKATGGDLGYFGRSGYAPEFVDAAFGAQPGQVVGPVKTGVGYEVLEVTDKRTGGTQPFEAVRAQIRARVAAEQAQQRVEAKAKELASSLGKNKPGGADGLRALAQPPVVTFNETGPIGAGDNVPNIGPGTAFSTTAFAMKKGEVSQPVQVPAGWAVLYVKDVKEPRTPTLAEVEPRVREAVSRQKLQQLALQKLEEAKRQIAGGKTLDQAAAELGLQVQESQEFGGQGMIPGLGYNPDLTKAALALQTGQVGGPVADSQGALLFQVTDHKGWDPKQYAANREQTRSTILQQKLSNLEGSLIEKRRRELGVEFNRQFLDQFGIAPPQAG
ncbi:MAG: peptidyl-prolyl cis-trans isomerase [Thermoanaerobaculia bacterium]